MKKAIFKIEGMHCVSCAMNIDGELEDTDGVKEASTNYARQLTEVTFEPGKVTVGELITTIKKLNDKYDATEVKNK